MICGLYGKVFTHKIVVQYIDGIYSLRLHVHDNFWCPLVMQLQTDSEDAFLDYICKELKERQLIRSDYCQVDLKNGRN